MIGATKPGTFLKNVQLVTTQIRAKFNVRNAKMAVPATTVQCKIRALMNKIDLLNKTNFVPMVSFAKSSAMLSKRHFVQMENTFLGTHSLTLLIAVAALKANIAREERRKNSCVPQGTIAKRM